MTTDHTKQIPESLLEVVKVEQQVENESPKIIKSGVDEIIHSSFLHAILVDEAITDVSYNGAHLTVKHNQKGRLLADIQPSKQEVSQLIKKIADIQGKDFTPTTPILDIELGFLRINAVHGCLSEKGITFAIRISPPKLLLHDLTEVAPANVVQLLQVLVQAKCNIIISGATGSGKTELQKALVASIPASQKIVLIEDTQDSHLKVLYPDKDIVSWHTLKDVQREHKISEHELMKAALRNDPEWIIISETRGSEAYDMLESALTGHAILTTIHANSANQIPARILRMICKNYSLNEQFLGKDITEVFQIGVHMQQDYNKTGIHRYIKEIVEFTGFDDSGAHSKVLYRKSSQLKSKRKYKDSIAIDQLTASMQDLLENMRLLHLIPEEFLM